MKLSAAACVVLAASVFAPLLHADARSDARKQVIFGISVAQKGLWREAVYRWEQAVKIDPTYAEAFNDLAVGYEQIGEFEKARQTYEKALELEPDNSQIRQNYDLFREVNERVDAERDSQP